MEESQSDDESGLSCPLEPVEAMVNTPSGCSSQGFLDGECKSDLKVLLGSEMERGRGRGGKREEEEGGEVEVTEEEEEEEEEVIVKAL